MNVFPESASVCAGEEQQFTTDAAATVKWQVSPGIGSIDQNGRYRAPKVVLNGRTVTIVARTAGSPPEQGHATIALSASPFWMGAIAVEWVLIFPLLIWLLFHLTPLEQARNTDVLRVAPAAVTLAPNGFYQFSARTTAGPTTDVAWTASAGTITATGLYTASNVKVGDTVVITAASKTAPALQATATVRCDAAGLSLGPASAELREKEKKSFAADPKDAAVTWDYSPRIGALSGGAYSAPDRIDRQEAIAISAVDAHGRVATAYAFLQPSTSGMDLTPELVTLLLVLTMGALGSSLGSARSFVNFVGSRKFNASWGLYYLLQPVFGAGLALLVYYGFRSGALIAPPGTSTSGIIGSLFLAGLVGLFSDTFLQKLKELVDTLFRPADGRTDKLGAKPAPVVSSVSASRSGNSIAIAGANFDDKCKVLVNGTDASTTRISDKSLTAALDAALASGAEIAIGVVNGDGQRSTEMKTHIQP